MGPDVKLVWYSLSEGDVAAIDQRREETRQVGIGGYQGNPIAQRDVYPAVVVKDFGAGLYNLVVFLDGHDTYWATSRYRGDEPGKWWPTYYTSESG